ncbi:hypothetical protein V495_04597 [Pseudogymnoascus sp. VKM F-4514 (FW-929)]|nr:hypothetical protein V495_04597 [Pseudogymnoascus sp. VKM F-4514 (FW-929)]KFY53688.1 hypothetical protein V497_08307 [Pseudogymnoascus sp. VKM F-4516 (FW-969)]
MVHSSRIALLLSRRDNNRRRVTASGELDDEDSLSREVDGLSERPSEDSGEVGCVDPFDSEADWLVDKLDNPLDDASRDMASSSALSKSQVGYFDLRHRSHQPSSP